MTPFIPRGIKSITKSPHPEQWTLALDNEIKSLISQMVFDLQSIDSAYIPKHLIIPSQVIFDNRMNLIDYSI